MVKELTINNQKVYVSFNMKAAFAFQKKTGKSISQIEEVIADGDLLEEFLYQGLKEGHRLKGVELTIKKEDVLVISPSDYAHYVVSISEAFTAEPVKKKLGLNGKTKK